MELNWKLLKEKVKLAMEEKDKLNKKKADECINRLVNTALNNLYNLIYEAVLNENQIMIVYKDDEENRHLNARVRIILEDYFKSLNIRVWQEWADYGKYNLLINVLDLIDNKMIK